MRDLFLLTIIFIGSYGTSWRCQAASNSPAMKINFEGAITEVQEQYPRISGEDLARVKLFLLTNCFNPWQEKYFVKISLGYLPSLYAFIIPDLSAAPETINYKATKDLIEAANPTTNQEILLSVKEQLANECFNYYATRKVIKQQLRRFISEQIYPNYGSDC